MTRTFSIATVALFLSLLSPAYAGKLYVANNGTDAIACGTQAAPCRSITRAITNAVAGDSIVVGPGRYGDLNRDGVLDDPGDEVPSPGCGCMLSVNKPVVLTSSGGAGSTIIDATSVPSSRNVLIILDGGEFGRAAKGFTVTGTSTGGNGITIDSANLKVRGNQLLAVEPGNEGIEAQFGGPILIEGNQVLGDWVTGIEALGTGKMVRRNRIASSFSFGITAEGDTVVFGNIVSGGATAMEIYDSVRVIGNAMQGNSCGIVMAGSESRPFTGSIQLNNFVGNSACGIDNSVAENVDARNNYWGAATGPGPGAADEVWDIGDGTTIVTPFATKPFSVKAPLKP